MSIGLSSRRKYARSIHGSGIIREFDFIVLRTSPVIFDAQDSTD
jgi:hypothetical protein